MDNYNDMARELGYDPTDPAHIEKMQEAFATDELVVCGLTEEDLAILQASEPGAAELVEDDEH